MYPGVAMICPERDRLLRQANAAANARQNAMAKLTEISGMRKNEEFARLTAELQELSIATLAAWDEYRNHLQEHGC